MTDITFITSNTTKLAHARHLCKDYDVNILQYKKLFYGKGYEEPRIFDREKLLEDSIIDAIKRWKKNVSNYGERLFFIEDTSVRIEALSDYENEVPGVDIKYWMQEYNFDKLDIELKKRGNNRKVKVISHIVLFLTDDLKSSLKSDKDYLIFSSFSIGTITEIDHVFDNQILYPWLDNKTFNKWFVPYGYDLPISMLNIIEADKIDFRKGAFENMLSFLKANNAILYSQKKSISPRLPFNPTYIVCGPTCAGKSSIGKLLLEKHGYYHVEASDFMSLSYFETHGTKFVIDKNIYAAELLKVNPLIVVERTLNYIQSKKFIDNFIVTGFRTSSEVAHFNKTFQVIYSKLIYVDSDLNIRYNRWTKRRRDNVEYSLEKFIKINELQEEMGLLEISKIENAVHYENDKDGLDSFFLDFEDKIIKTQSISTTLEIAEITSVIHNISLEKAILIVLAIEFNKNESKYFTTTEISRLINMTFLETSKNKNNVSRYFNQTFYPYYEITKDIRKIKYKLSPTGYSEAVFIIQTLTMNQHS
jgi:inosine/xanthosine triphosphate pyrophosphatase family protein/adenylate kinase family enzyme